MLYFRPRGDTGLIIRPLAEGGVAICTKLAACNLGVFVGILKRLNLLELGLSGFWQMPSRLSMHFELLGASDQLYYSPHRVSASRPPG